MIPIEIGITVIVIVCAYGFLHIKIALIHRRVMMDKAKKMTIDADRLLNLYCVKFNIPKDAVDPSLTMQEIFNAFKYANTDDML